MGTRTFLAISVTLFVSQIVSQFEIISVEKWR